MNPAELKRASMFLCMWGGEFLGWAIFNWYQLTTDSNFGTLRNALSGGHRKPVGEKEAKKDLFTIPNGMHSTTKIQQK